MRCKPIMGYFYLCVYVHFRASTPLGCPSKNCAVQKSFVADTRTSLPRCTGDSASKGETRYPIIHYVIMCVCGENFYL